MDDDIKYQIESTALTFRGLYQLTYLMILIIDVKLDIQVRMSRIYWPMRIVYFYTVSKWSVCKYVARYT